MLRLGPTSGVSIIPSALRAGCAAQYTKSRNVGNGPAKVRKIRRRTRYPKAYVITGTASKTMIAHFVMMVARFRDEDWQA
jgi:hypothetical protein